ncbi:MAG TPA: ABC transporter substrate-binding protein [Rhizomicrobium sp.]|jgi:peptide/nickel transport system substrate-binding protein
MGLHRRAVLGAAAGLPFFVQHAQAARSGVLNAMMPVEPASLCYPLLNTRLTQQICSNIHESLLLFDWQFKPHPNLAKSFTVSSDGLVYTFVLQPDVRWHDGVPFTARDVVFSCDVMLRQLNPRSRNALAHCESILALDSHTVEFRLKQPFNAFLLSLMASSAPMMPAHIYEGTDFRTNPFNFKPIGTGPFKFARWERGQYIRLTRNEHYWRSGQPRLHDIYFRVCPTPEQRMVAIETGAVDVAFADDIDTVVTSRLLANPALVSSTKGYIAVGEITVMEMNQRRWPFSDRRFRAAFMHALDREFLVKAINFGQGKVATGPIPSTAPYYDEKVLTKYPFDPARARALLDEMGLKPKRGGVRHRFGFMLVPDGGGAWTRGAQYAKQAVADVGLEMELESADWSTFSRRSGNWDFDMDCNSYGEYGDPAIGTSRFFLSSNIRKGVPLTNVQGYINPEVDDLFAKAAVALSREEAQAHYSRLQQILTRDVAMLWMYERAPMLFQNRRVQNLITGPNGPSDGFGQAFIA